MRQIILDTETTGLDPALGNRILEIGGVEIINRQITGKYFHRYVNPERASEDGALQVHGITEDFLADKPKFRDIAQEFLDYVAGAELVIHNAAFDVSFLNHELRLLNRKPLRDYCPSVLDTLKLARELHPGKRNSLDALCDRYQVNNAGRTLHGALLDAQLLAEVYLSMTRGQGSLLMEAVVMQPKIDRQNKQKQRTLRLLLATDEEIALHEGQLAEIDKASAGTCLWTQLGKS